MEGLNGRAIELFIAAAIGISGWIIALVAVLKLRAWVGAKTITNDRRGR